MPLCWRFTEVLALILQVQMIRRDRDNVMYWADEWEDNDAPLVGELTNQ